MKIFLKTICVKLLTLCENNQWFPIFKNWLTPHLCTKKYRKDLKENYRPVSILLTLSKISESIMFTHSVLNRLKKQSGAKKYNFN